VIIHPSLAAIPMKVLAVLIAPVIQPVQMTSQIIFLVIQEMGGVVCGGILILTHPRPPHLPP